MSYLNTLRTEDFQVRIEERLRIQRSKEYNHGLSMLIPQEGEKTWGEKKKAQVLWLTELSKDWTFQERAKWREGLPKLPTWRRRAGQKRSYSKVKKPGKDQRKPIKLSAQVNPVVPPVSALVPVPGDPVVLALW